VRQTRIVILVGSIIILFALLELGIAQVHECAHRYPNDMSLNASAEYYNYFLNNCTDEIYNDIYLIDLKRALDTNNIHDEASEIAGEYTDFFDYPYYCINKICNIYDFMIYGKRCYGGWLFDSDPRASDYLSSASETLETGKSLGRSGRGDCDDFAILLASFIESIGGSTRLMLAKNGTANHMYVELYLGTWGDDKTDVMLDWIKNRYHVDELYYHRSNDYGVWLNMDYWSYPGGPFYNAKRHIILPANAYWLTEPIICREIANPDYTVHIEGQKNETINAYDKNGDLWIHKTNASISHVLVCDLNNDMDYETLVATGASISGNVQNVSGRLILFDKRGCVLDEYNTWKPTIYKGSSDGKQSRVTDLQVADLTGDGKMEILVLSRDEYWYSSRLSILEIEKNRFKEVSIYWNPGFLYKLYIDDVNGDGIKEVVCVGTNNDLQNIYPLNFNTNIAIAFNGSNISGQAPPWFGNESPGTELWYYFLNKGDNLRTIDQIRLQEDFNKDGVRDFQICLNNSCSWYVDYIGDILGTCYGSACTEAERNFTKIISIKYSNNI